MQFELPSLSWEVTTTTALYPFREPGLGIRPGVHLASTGLLNDAAALQRIHVDKNIINCLISII